jgi:hypothetical protein
MRIALDPERVSTLAGKVYPHGLPQVSGRRADYIGDADSAIIDAANRLLKVIAQPQALHLAIIFPFVGGGILQRLYNSSFNRWYPLLLTGSRVPSRRIATRLSFAYSSIFSMRSMLMT